jgi:hypothetical protein
MFGGACAKHAQPGAAIPASLLDSKVRVETPVGPVDGTMTSTSSTHVTLRTTDRVYDIPIAEVGRIKTTDSYWKPGAWIAGVPSALMGVMIGALANGLCESDCDDSDGALIAMSFTVVGTASGALVGRAIPRHNTHYEAAASVSGPPSRATVLDYARNAGMNDRELPPPRVAWTAIRFQLGVYEPLVFDHDIVVDGTGRLTLHVPIGGVQIGGELGVYGARNPGMVGDYDVPIGYYAVSVRNTQLVATSIYIHGIAGIQVLDNGGGEDLQDGAFGYNVGAGLSYRPIGWWVFPELEVRWTHDEHVGFLSGGVNAALAW